MRLPFLNRGKDHTVTESAQTVPKAAAQESLYRHGDLLLRRRTDPESPAFPPSDTGPRMVLAYGEATGHAHVLEAEEVRRFDAAGPVTIIELGSPGELSHEEHGTINLQPGVYEVVHQREYSPDDRARYVND